MPATTLKLLGDFAVETPAGEAVRLGRKGQALLACAARSTGAGVHRGRLTGLLWPEFPEDDARSALRQCLHGVRRALGAAATGLVNSGERIALDPAAFSIDVERFEALGLDAHADVQLAAAKLYRGDFLRDLDAGPEFGAWAAGERARLRDTACALLARLAAQPLPPDGIEAAVQLAHRLLATDPLDEATYQALMRLYAAGGRRSKALEAWQACRRALRRELDVEPAEQTRQLARELRIDSDIAPASAPAMSILSNVDAPRSMRSETPVRSAEVQDLLLHGWQQFSLYSPQANARARTAFEGALARCAHDAEIMAYLGWTHWFDSISGWTADAARSYRLAEACATRAIQWNCGHPSPHAVQGKVLLWKGQHDAALEQLRKAVEVGPRSAYAWFNLGDALMFSGHLSEALECIDKALSINPNDHGMFLTIRGHVHWLQEESAAARAALESAVTRNPNYPWAYGLLAAVHAECGDIESARVCAEAAARLNRRYSISFAQHVLPFRNPADRARLVRALRLAGVRAKEARLPAMARSSPSMPG